MRPTKIVKEPKIVESQDILGRRRRIMTFVCDDGKTYGFNELAAVIGINDSTLRTRLARNHWGAPIILSRNNNRLGSGYVQESGGPTDEWKALSGKPRDYNLKRCRSWGTYDSITSKGFDNVMG